MTRALFLFRPEPGWSQSAAAARAMGLTVEGAPLLAIEPISWDVPESGDFDGLLIGSANVFRLGGVGLEALKSLPVFCVGESTSQAARETGFDIAMAGSGGLQLLLDTLTGRELRLLRLRGEKHVALAPPLGIEVDDHVVYRAAPLPLDMTLAERLTQGGVVALHSGEAARRFASECDRLGIDRSGLALAVLSPRIADLAGEGWQAIHIAERPTDGELLALAGALCQTA